MIDAAVTPLGTFREVYGKGPLDDRWIFQCPGCGIWAYMDEDQWYGRVSVQHPEGSVRPDCTYHETHNYYEALKEHLGREP